MRVTPNPLLGVLLLWACDSASEPDPEPMPAAQATVAREVVDVSFSEIYQIFLFRTLSPQAKAERWATQYKDRWVRWTGQLAAVSSSGLKIRHIQGTMTFDVSLVVNEPQRSQLRRQLAVGKFYTYMARLDRYDDLFRTLYLDQGVVLAPSHTGVAGTLVPTPPKLRAAPGAAPQGAPGPGSSKTPGR